MSSVKKPHSVKLPYLYKEAGKVLKAYSEKKGSLKTLVYSTHCSQLYSRLFAVVYRVDQHWAQLDAVLKETRLLEENSKLNPFVARVLITELLWGSGQLQSEARPVLTVRACSDSLRAAAANPLLPSADVSCKPPRYARVNTLKTSLEDVLQDLTNDGWRRVPFSCDDYDSFISAVRSLSEYEFLLDFHVGDLLVFAAGTNLVQSRLYGRRWLVLQDKASCLPALLMQPSEGDYIIDACAAPGMKTSHMAALMHNTGTLVAVERDGQRLKTLNTLLSELGVQNCRTMCADFMRVDPAEHSRCTAILLDPSCSGTGMLDRPTDESGPDAQRLLRLSNLQGMLLRHALSFPSVERVVYSTCSTTVQENEQVVAEALSNHPQWQLATVAPAIWRAFGKPEFPFWRRCMRTETKQDLCCGFFVAVFHRKTTGGVNQPSDVTDEVSSTVGLPDSRNKGGSNRKRKRKVTD